SQQCNLTIAIVERGKELRNHRKAQIAVNGNVRIKEMSNVDGNVFNFDITYLDRINVAVNDFKLATTTNCASHAAPCYRFQSYPLRCLLRDDGHTRTRIQNKF